MKILDFVVGLGLFLFGVIMLAKTGLPFAFGDYDGSGTAWLLFNYDYVLVLLGSTYAGFRTLLRVYQQKSFD